MNDIVRTPRGGKLFSLFEQSHTTSNARASEFEWVLGEDGFREGWCERAAQLRGLVSFGEGGVPFDGDTGLPLEAADLAALAVSGAAFECRARAELGDVEKCWRSPLVSGRVLM